MLSMRKCQRTPPPRRLFKTVNIVKVCLTGQLHERRAGKKRESVARMVSQPEFGSGRHCSILLEWCSGLHNLSLSLSGS